MQGQTAGGGARAAGAIPAMLNGQAMQNAAHQQNLNWNPFP